MSSNFYRRYVPSSSNHVLEKPTPEQASNTASQTASKTEPFFKRYVPPAKPVRIANNNENADGDVDMPARPAKRQKHHNVLTHREKDEQIEVSRENHVPSSNGERADADLDETNEGFGKHQRMRERYEKAQKLSDERKQQVQDTHAAADGEKDGEVAPAIIEQHGLEPLPQPINREEPAVVQKTPLPYWLANPMRIRADGPGIEMGKTGLGETTLKNLLKRGFDKAFAVQAAVMPMLLPDGDSRHYGDVCVSASTGSGKTLSYVLPMIEALKEKPTRLLRGLIVVPTRELVNQVKETVEMCIHQTGIKLGIAVGNKTLAEDRRQLLERRLKFDMDAFKESERRRKKPTIEELMDWDTDSEDEYDVPYGHIAALRSAVDILICTPGRLVDHVRSTKGFHLHDVQWLVIDEADKLLDQSFQQWIDTIMPELRHLPPVDDVEQKMRAFLHMPQRRTVQKVILSATMTRDVSKLLPLDLQNPKLVLVEGQDAEGEAEGDTAIYELPSSLRETAVMMGRDDEKPIVLFRLLEEVLATDEGKNVPVAPATVKMNTDTSGSDTGNSESDSSSNSDSDSDSTASNSSNEAATANGSTKGVYDTSSSDSSDSSDSDSASESEISSEEGSAIALDGERPTPKNGTKPKARINSAVRDRTANGILVFTNTNESAQRLSRLLALLEPSWLSHTSFPGQQVATLTKSTASSSSRRLLSAFRSGRLPVLIASDRAARGLDVADLGLVINYDVPPGVASYVHRVGRTARAGKTGHAYTIVAHHEARWFWKEIGKGPQVRRTSGEAGVATAPGSGSGSGAQGKVRRKDGLGKDVPEDLMRRYEASLKKLGDEAQGGRQK